MNSRKGMDVSLSIIVSIMVGIVVAVTLAYVFSTRGDIFQGFALKNLGINISLSNVVS